MSTRTERLERLRALHLLRNEARKLNHEEVVEEDKRNNLPANYEAKQKRAEYLLNEEKQKEECRLKGLEYSREKRLEITADDADKKERQRKRKQLPATEFDDYEEKTFRQYLRNTKELKPNMHAYVLEKDKVGEDAFYPSSNTVLIGKHRDSKEAVDKMVADLDRQLEKRAKFHRRRTFDPDDNVDYINERNRRFNRKVEHYYGPYTQEIKQNLERGTAV